MQTNGNVLEFIERHKFKSGGETYVYVSHTACAICVCKRSDINWDTGQFPTDPEKLIWVDGEHPLMVDEMQRRFDLSVEQYGYCPTCIADKADNPAQCCDHCKDVLALVARIKNKAK